MKWLRWLRKKELVVPPAEPTLGEESKLRQRVSKAADGAPLADEDWALVDQLVARGREQAAIELLRNFVATRPDDLVATLRLAELLCGRLEHTPARPLLERLTRAPAQRESPRGPRSPFGRKEAERALHLLAEEAERAGELDRARQTWERLLAWDIDHARARAAVARLAIPRRRSDEVALPTLDGPQHVGTPVSGRYRLRAELGRGASGTVYRAEDVALEREIALKILHPHARGLGGASEARLRAWQEARISAALRHPGVAVIYDLDEDRQLISMELCRGGSLRDRLLSGSLPAKDALRALAQLADVLAAAHAVGIVHGDVKPANLLLRHQDEITDDDLVLCDFGVARLSDDAAPAVEQRAARGTLVYMAPEQRRGMLTPAADVWAAGVVLLELLGGHAALQSALGDRAALLRGDLRYDTTLAPSVAASVGNALPETSALLAALLSPDPTVRPTASQAAARARTVEAML